MTGTRGLGEEWLTTATLESDAVAPAILRVSEGDGSCAGVRVLPVSHLAFVSVPAAPYNAVGTARWWWFAHPAGRPLPNPRISWPVA